MEKKTNENSLTKGFLIIPKEILSCVKYKGKPLGFPEKALYSYLFWWSVNKNKVFPSAARMCEDLGIGSRTSISKYLSKLEVLGLISIIKVKGKSSEYKILPFEGLSTEGVHKESITKGTRSGDKLEHDVKQEIHPDIVDGDFNQFIDDDPFGEDMGEDWIPF